jgi:hypothetical protein
MGFAILSVIVFSPMIGLLVSGLKLAGVGPDMHEERRKWRRRTGIFGVLTALSVIVVVGWFVLVYYALSHQGSD